MSMRRHGCRSLNLLHAMQPLMTSFILLSFMIICRASSFLRQVGCGQLSRRQTQNALVRFHASSTSAVAQTTGETAIVSKDDSSTITSLLPYFSIYYNDVWEVDMPPGHRFPMSKYKKVRKAVQSHIHDSKQQIHCDFRVSPLASFEDIATTHCPEYIQRYLSGNMTDAENRNIGFPWTLQHVNRTLSSTGGTVAAACDAYEEYLRRCDKLGNDGQTDNAHLCWSAHVAGGTHHAFRDYGEGFCIFSDIAVAANVLLQKFPYQSSTTTDLTTTKSQGIRRILIIDLDVHQGNGNAALFQGNDKVQTFSVHCRSNYFSKKEKSDLDIELPAGCEDDTYLTTLKHWLRRIEEHPFDDDYDQQGKQSQKPFDFIFYQAGVDIHKDDRLGRLSISQEGVSRRNHLVYDFAHRMRAPLVICMGGGYPRDDWAPILTAHAGVYIEAHQYLSSFGRD